MGGRGDSGYKGSSIKQSNNKYNLRNVAVIKDEWINL